MDTEVPLGEKLYYISECFKEAKVFQEPHSSAYL